jgi:hypothetical protein
MLLTCLIIVSVAVLLNAYNDGWNWLKVGWCEIYGILENSNSWVLKVKIYTIWVNSKMYIGNIEK